MDNFKNKDIWDKYSLLNLYFNIKHKTNKKISFAPDKLLLKKFGGHLTIDEYRKNYTNDIHDIYIPPIIHINYNYNLSGDKKQKIDKSELKLYRKTEIINKSNIFNSMNLSKNK